MPRTVNVETPDGIIAYDNVPDDVPDWRVKLQNYLSTATSNLPDAPGWLKALGSGAVKGVMNNAQLVIGAQHDQNKTMEDIWNAGRSENDPARVDLRKYGKAATATVDQLTDAFGGNYQPETPVAEYLKAASQGAAGAAVPGGGFLTGLSMGAAQGLADKAVEKNMPEGETRDAIRSFAIPAASIALIAGPKRLLTPRKASKTVQQAFSETPPEVHTRAAILRQEGIDAGVPLMPAQTYPDHPIVGLHNDTVRSPGGGPLMHERLRQQAEQAAAMLPAIPAVPATPGIPGKTVVVRPASERRTLINGQKGTVSIPEETVTLPGIPGSPGSPAQYSDSQKRVLAAASQGRSGVNRFDVGTDPQNTNPISTTLRTLGTGATFGALPHVREFASARAQRMLAEALSDPSGVALQKLLKSNPNEAFITNALRSYLSSQNLQQE